MRVFFCLLTLLFLNFDGKSQSIYPEKFSGCLTDHFVMESDSIRAKTDIKRLIKIVLSELDEKSKSKISGVLSLQIIVNLDGSSCLISMKNETNIKTSKFVLKEIIDRMKWEIPSKKASPLIQLKFNPNSVQYRRIGINGKKGNHIIEEDEFHKNSLN